MEFFNEMEFCFQDNYLKNLKNKTIFRKKLSEKQQNVKHRPAQLFSFDQDKFKEMIETDHYSFKMY